MDMDCARRNSPAGARSARRCPCQRTSKRRHSVARCRTVDSRPTALRAPSHPPSGGSGTTVSRARSATATTVHPPASHRTRQADAVSGAPCSVRRIAGTASASHELNASKLKREERAAHVPAAIPAPAGVALPSANSALDTPLARQAHDDVSGAPCSRCWRQMKGQARQGAAHGGDGRRQSDRWQGRGCTFNCNSATRTCAWTTMTHAVGALWAVWRRPSGRARVGRDDIDHPPAGG
ncbi:hypothetical protein FA95DRAFT_985225 [Auriscalpium vulgare]|uniref:Uncharacterized protein n=1 Tax=Auriscalpium vulgare TaxID=40419 RepID=A0ACB8RXN0_9AGAM|nr:hypothetical protein FA95DRAFT_985225 [Auriscalpium vulgare]